jgi:uncharacterized protein (DUF362 family)
MPSVVITHDRDSIERAITDALDRIPLEKLIRGKLVAVRPNDTWASADDISGVTHADTLLPIDLAITVGHPAMIATGPLGGYPVETGIVIASTDAVAADVVGANLLGFHTQAVDTCGRRGGWGWEKRRLRGWTSRRSR